VTWAELARAAARLAAVRPSRARGPPAALQRAALRARELSDPSIGRLRAICGIALRMPARHGGQITHN